jgi:arylsulfatase A-like enzyme
MRRPNILLIYTDQQRWDTLNSSGNPTIHTPNLDALAREGVTFDHHFVQHPLCMPSRVSMLTGQYPATLGITHMGVPVPPDTVTLPRLLHSYGYRTANFGKLHFQPHANRDHRAPHPAYGFDELAVSDEPGVYMDAYRAWVRHKLRQSGRDMAQLDRLSVGLPPARHIWQQVMDHPDPVSHPSTGERDDFTGAIPFPADDDLTHSAFVADQAIDFIRRQTGDQPFLCIAGFFAPHAPWVVPQTYLDQYDRDALPLPNYPQDVNAQRPADPAARFSDAQLRSAKHGYYAMISEVDHYVGSILSTLAAQNFADNTIVVFTSDHGEWLGDHLRYGKGYPGDDATSRTPLIIHAPGGTAHRQPYSGIVEAVDIVPTLLDLAAIQAPSHLQGRSLAPVIFGQPDTGRSSALMEATGWKALRTNRFRYLLHEDGSEMLWDLTRDPGEYHDVAGEAAYADDLAECRNLLLQRLLVRERPLPRTWPY